MHSRIEYLWVGCNLGAEVGLRTMLVELSGAPVIVVA